MFNKKKITSYKKNGKIELLRKFTLKYGVKADLRGSKIIIQVIRLTNRMNIVVKSYSAFGQGRQGYIFLHQFLFPSMMILP